MELLRALATFVDEPGAAHARVAAALDLPCAPDPAAHTDCFSFTLYPYASVHLGPEGQLGGEARDRVAGFFRALGAVVPPEPDHLVVLLTAYGQLREHSSAAAGHAARALLHEHLLSWLPLYLARVRATAAAPYPQWAALVDEALFADASADDGVSGLPLHLRAAPTLPDPRVAGHDAFVGGLLAPARSGLLLTAADVRRAARELGLGLRVGERRFVLDALLGQDAGATLRWWAAHARTTTQAWEPWVPVARPTARWWIARAGATQALLDELALDADGLAVGATGGAGQAGGRGA
jgi:hypothetical protein